MNSAPSNAFGVVAAMLAILVATAAAPALRAIDTVAASWSAAGGSGTALALPDPTLTPGRADDDDADVVCAPRYAGARRPRYDAGWRALASYVHARYRVPRGGRYTIDHLVPLELGGAPADSANLWPQPRAEALLKDRVEDALHRAVCDSRTVTLRDAQRAIATDWRATPVGDPRTLPPAFSERSGTPR